MAIALNLLPFAGIAFLWFIGVVRDRLGEGEDRFFATVFLGSGLLFVAMLFVSGADASALLVDPGSDSVAPNDTVWSYGRRFTYSLISVYAMRMAGVFMMSTTTLALRLGFVPKWMVYAGFIGAIIAVADDRQDPARRADLPDLGLRPEHPHPDRHPAPDARGRRRTGGCSDGVTPESKVARNWPQLLPIRLLGGFRARYGANPPRSVNRREMTSVRSPIGSGWPPTVADG